MYRHSPFTSALAVSLLLLGGCSNTKPEMPTTPTDLPMEGGPSLLVEEGGDFCTREWMWYPGLGVVIDEGSGEQIQYDEYSICHGGYGPQWGIEYGDGRPFAAWDSLDNVESDLYDIYASEQSLGAAVPIVVIIARLATHPRVVEWATARDISPEGLVHRLANAYNSIGPRFGGQLHHLGTIANSISTRTGGPWTPRFQSLFARYGMSLNHALNRVLVQGHKGPHSQAYHSYVFTRLDAVRTRGGYTSFAEELDAFMTELMMLGYECATPGTPCNTLLLH